MFSLSGLDISITKGDTGTVAVTLTGEVPPNGTIALVSVKKRPNSNNLIWEKRFPIQDGAFSFDLTQADTELSPARYWWDIRLLYESGAVFTPMEPSAFIILEVVGDA